MPEPLLDIQNVRLSIPIIQPGERKLLVGPVQLISSLYFSGKRRKEHIILDGINFQIHAGDRIAVLGHNGAGKSSLLRLLANIYYPTRGHVMRKGQASGLFDISLGMNSQATGLENIYLRGLQMGMSLKNIREKIPDILEFTELDKSLYQLFDTYSTGMKLRLAFAVSTLIEPDILLLDEWLGAGDATFKQKVQERMDGLVANSRAMVLASHNENLLKKLCTKGLVLSGGKQQFFGPLDEALALYKDGYQNKHSPDSRPV